MVGAIRVVSVERGHDPRDFTMVAFGGAGPLHGCSLADLLGIARVLVPPAPGVLCAEGLLAADLRAEFSRTLPRAGRIEPGLAEAAYAELEREARSWFDEEGVTPPDRGCARVALLRYHGQGGELAVPWAEGVADTQKAFSDAHQALYGFTLYAPIELVTVRIEASGKMPPAVRPALSRGAGVRTNKTRPVHFIDGRRDVPV